MNKKIAIVANSTWNIYNFRQELIRTLKEYGFRVIVIAPMDEYIHYLNENYFTKHISLRHLKSQGTNMIKDLRLLLELVRIFRVERPDIVLNYTIKPNIYSSIAARWLDIPCISTLTGLGHSFIQVSFKTFIVKRLYAYALQKNKCVVFHNNDDLDLFIDKHLIHPLQAIHIPGSGVDTKKFVRKAEHRRENFTFLFVGRLLKEKGLMEFIHASIQVKAIIGKANFWVVGHWSEDNPASIDKDELIHWIEKRQITYFGADKDIRKYLNRADALVLPSYREGVPRAVLEAMAMQLPIITCDTPGCRDTVEHKINGLLVPPKDCFALAKAMVDLYNLSEEERRQMGRLNREKVLRQFDVEIINKKYMQLLHTVLVGSKNTLPTNKELSHYV